MDLRKYRLFAVVATWPCLLWSSQPASAASLLMSGNTILSHRFPAMMSTPGGRVTYSSVLFGLLGHRFDADDVVELDLDKRRFRIHPDAVPYEILTGSLDFSELDLTRSVAVFTELRPRFLVGYGRNTINSFATVTYVGELNYNVYKEIQFDEVTADFDDDGITDAFETANQLDPLDPADSLLDPDNDGLNNLAEFNARTDPNDPDSDGDGIMDGLDDAPGVASNLCSGDDAIFQNVNISSGQTETCAAVNSVQVEDTVSINPGGKAKVISPFVTFMPNFSVPSEAGLSVKSTSPLP